MLPGPMEGRGYIAENRVSERRDFKAVLGTFIPAMHTAASWRCLDQINIMRSFGRTARAY